MFDLFCFLFFGCPEGVFTKPANPSRKLKIQKKTKENNNTLGTTNETTFLKVSDPPLDMFCLFVLFVCVFPTVFVVLFCIVGFLEGVVGFVKKNLRENQTTKTISKEESETFKSCVVCS